jgi:hypothetical protein
MAYIGSEHEKVKKIHPSITFVVCKCPSTHVSLILSRRFCRDCVVCIGGVSVGDRYPPGPLEG